MVRDTTIIPFDENTEFMQRVQKSEVDGVLKKIKQKKAVRPDCMPIEIWRCLV